MNSTPLVSVIVPVYNRAHLVGRSVGSLCKQSYTNLDIIVVDDCSTDDIVGAVSAINDSRIRLIHLPVNGGASAARNAGVLSARGNFIAFHDSDDVYVFDKIERQVDLMKNLSSEYVGVHTAVLFYSGLEEEHYNEIKIKIRPFPRDFPLSGDLFERTLQGNSFNLPTLLVRRDALLSAGPSDELMRNNVDWDLALRLTRIGKLAFIPEPLYLSENHTDPAISRKRISRSSRYSAQSFVRITGKIRRMGFIDSSLAKHYSSAARHLILIGHGGFARRFLRAAMRIDPLSWRYWVQYLASFSPHAFSYLRALRRRLTSR